MTKKFFAACLIGTAIFMTGCSDDAENFDAEKPNVAQAMTKQLPTFNATDLDGKPVTNEIFAAKKITIVNIWGTFCPPCIGEMPELGEMAKNMPADAQLIGLVCDAESNSPQIQEAKKILRDAGANFVNIVPDENLMRFLNNVEAVPTTIFVNSKGEIVGQMIVGADVEGYKDELAKLLK
ncbi:MAG: TlpA family protein disulfide reductase [Selenomonadaceae bacterium]|nr:TlpA family protein disulfide reductase [Selenomonadaceae bacterium]MBR4383466.1 TlpA family protein disulfide reductase [Selenomonadaceae bacterium]